MPVYPGAQHIIAEALTEAPRCAEFEVLAVPGKQEAVSKRPSAKAVPKRLLLNAQLPAFLNAERRTLNARLHAPIDGSAFCGPSELLPQASSKQ
jgi:hypothetical protein